MRHTKIYAMGLTAVLVMATAVISATGNRQEASQQEQPTYTPVEIEAPAPSIVTPENVLLSAAASPLFDLPESHYPVYKYEYTNGEVDMMAQTVWGEARGCSPEEQRLVIWTILQRVDDERFPDTIEGVIVAPNQFAGYDADHPVMEDIRTLCLQELGDWIHECPPPTLEPYAATTPYLFFDGDGRHNWFREEWND